MIAMALAGQPDLLVADEPTTALDATIQAQILALLAGIRRDTGMALVLISHDLGVVAENVNRVAVMYAGRMVEEAPRPGPLRRATASLHAGPAGRAADPDRPAPPPRRHSRQRCRNPARRRPAAPSRHAVRSPSRAA